MSYLHQNAFWVKWGLGGGGGGGGGGEKAYFYNNFYETPPILHLNRKWGREFKSGIPDLHTDFIHLTIQCCVLVILMQEIFPKGKGN